jgi:hypothetical protein
MYYVLKIGYLVCSTQPGGHPREKIFEKCQIRIPRMFLPLEGLFPEKILVWVVPYSVVAPEVEKVGKFW